MKPQLRKPQSVPQSGQAAVDVEALINRGGSAPQPTAEPEEPERKPIMVHIPTGVLSDIERLRKTRRIKTSRTAWIMEAIVEKLDREVSA
jgi:hypothetical protein